MISWKRLFTGIGSQPHGKETILASSPDREWKEVPITDLFTEYGGAGLPAPFTATTDTNTFVAEIGAGPEGDGWTLLLNGDGELMLRTGPGGVVVVRVGADDIVTVRENQFAFEGTDGRFYVNGGGMSYRSTLGAILFEVLPDGAIRGKTGKSITFDL